MYPVVRSIIGGQMKEKGNTKKILAGYISILFLLRESFFCEFLKCFILSVFSSRAARRNGRE